MKSKHLTRRGFAQGAAAFMVMAPALAQGTAVSEKLKVGIIGLGGRGRLIGRLLLEHGGYHIAALADYFSEVVRTAGESFGVDGKHCHSALSGYQRLLDEDLDAVFLETPPYCFPEHVETAVAAGMHVYIAKPLGCDVPGCLRIARAGEQAAQVGRVFLVDFQTRTDPFIIEGVRRMRNGDIGPLGMLSAIYTDEGFRDPPVTDTVESRLQHLVWVNDDALGGGYLVNAGIHAVDLALWMAYGHPERAMGVSRTGRAEAHGDSHDLYSVTYQFSDRVVMNYQGEHVHNQFGFRANCIAQCQAGYLTAGYSTEARMYGNSTSYDGGKVVDLYNEGIRRNLRTFHQAVVQGNTSNPTIAPAVNATLASILGREAARKGYPLGWEDMLKENRRLEPDLSGLKV